VLEADLPCRSSAHEFCMKRLHDTVPIGRRPVTRPRPAPAGCPARHRLPPKGTECAPASDTNDHRLRIRSAFTK
jgi:hypothetical protein